jgi:hypothetical protein
LYPEARKEYSQLEHDLSDVQLSQVPDDASTPKAPLLQNLPEMQSESDEHEAAHS